MIAKSSRKINVLCRIPFAHYGIPSHVCSAPECTVFASQQDSGLMNIVEAQSAAREALSSLPVCPLIGTLKKPTPCFGGFVECATFLHFTNRLL
jgi:hypothetical protein